MLIAGKGHEKYQVIGDRTLPFDDVEVARAALARRRSGSRVIVAAWIAIALTAGEIAAVDRRAVGAGRPRISRIERVSIDSRTLGAGRPVRRDPRRSVRRARLRRRRAGRGCGGRGGRRRRRPPRQDGGPAPFVIEVDDTTRALQDGAREVRRRSGAKVVAITGSAGKTTTKELTAEFLSARYSVFRNKGNLNNHIGLPLSLLELRRRPDVAVVELGMNHAGEIRTLVGIAEPDVRVWTNVGDAHLGFFASADAIADAKAEILEQARPDRSARRQRRRSRACRRASAHSPAVA